MSDDIRERAAWVLYDDRQPGQQVVRDDISRSAMVRDAMSQVRPGDLPGLIEALGQWVDSIPGRYGLVEVEVVVGEEPEEGVEFEVVPRCRVQVNEWGCAGEPGHDGDHLCVERRA